MMTLIQRYRRLTLWNKMGFWGSVASTVGLVIAVVTWLFSWPESTPPQAQIHIEQKTTGAQSPTIHDTEGVTITYARQPHSDAKTPRSPEQLSESGQAASQDKVHIKQETRGDKSPAIIGDNAKIIYGFTEEELMEELGVTRVALKSFFRVLEEKQVPLEDLIAKLREIATTHNALQENLQRITSEDPKVLELRRQARQALTDGNFEEAERLLKEAQRRDLEVIDELEEILKKRRFSAAVTTGDLGDLKIIQLAYADAALYYREAAGLVAEDDAKTQATYLHDEGTAWWQAGQYAKALSPLEQALHLRENALGSEHADVASSLNNLAVLYQAQGLYAQAEPLYKRALAIEEKVLGPDHPRVATGLNNLALLYEAQGLYAQAEPLYKRALAIKEKVLGPDHPRVATGLNNLAGLYQAQGLYAQAEPLYKRALASDEKVLGPDHPNTLTILRNYLNLLSMTNREPEAKVLLARLQASQPKRAWLGIGLKSQDNPAGILVTQVIENGPAAQSGIESNDLIVRLNGSNVHNTQAFIQVVGALPPETTVEIDVMRRGQPHTISVTLGLRPIVMPQE